MLYRELEDCEQCPLKIEEICHGGMMCTHGGVPIDPPCCDFTGDTDLDKWVDDYYARYDKIKCQELAAYENKLLKQHKAEVAKRKRAYLKMYCTQEQVSVNAIKKHIKSLEKFNSFVESMAFAINTTNEMFNYSERVSANKKYTDELQQLQVALAVAEQRLKQKQCEGRQMAAYKSIK